MRIELPPTTKADNLLQENQTRSVGMLKGTSWLLSGRPFHYISSKRLQWLGRISKGYNYPDPFPGPWQEGGRLQWWWTSRLLSIPGLCWWQTRPDAEWKYFDWFEQSGSNAASSTVPVKKQIVNAHQEIFNNRIK